jgi:exo-beta-1,3-glucanase (GH17 family)
MKKLNLFLSALTVASALSFAGCTSTSNTSSNNNTSSSTITSTEEKHTVTLVKNNGEANATRQIRHGKTFVEPEYEMQYYVIEG